MKNKLKNPHQANQGNKIKGNPDVITVTNHKHPIFCFKFIHRDYGLSQCVQDEKIAFLEQMFRLSQLTWQQIEQTQKHGLGSEKIAISSLHAQCPSIVTEDVTFLLALRFLGNAPFVGYRDRFILHILFIDRAFTLYDHG